MAYLNLEKATSPEREALALIRAEAWAKELSKEEFCERNKILYSHPFGKNRVETFLLKNPEKKIVSSMDALQVKIFFRENETQKTEIRDGFLIASVMTPIQHRHKGYASFLIKEFLNQQKWGIGVLYSDIGAKFYERYGFQKTKIQTREIIEPFESSSTEPITLKIDDWIEKFCSFRQMRFELTPGAQISLVPETDFWDWQLERYRYFSKLKGESHFSPAFCEIQTPRGPSYFSVVRNALNQTGDVLWFDSNCREALPSIGKVVQSWGLKKMHFWSSKDQGRILQEETPMGWFQGATKPLLEGFYDPQLCDWW